MTRKEELEKLAADLAGGHYECEDAWYSCPLSPDGCADDGKGSICTCGATQRQASIFQALQQVEREVLERVAKHLEGEAVKSRDFENKLMRKGQLEEASEIQTQRITEEAYAAWVREQQKELG